MLSIYLPKYDEYLLIDIPRFFFIVTSLRTKYIRSNNKLYQTYCVWLWFYAV